MKRPAISGTYKRQTRLAEAIECFLHQDYPTARLELIVLDDAGPEGHSGQPKEGSTARHKFPGTRFGLLKFVILSFAPNLELANKRFGAKLRMTNL